MINNRDLQREYEKVKSEMKFYKDNYEQLLREREALKEEDINGMILESDEIGLGVFELANPKERNKHNGAATGNCW